MQWPEKVIIDEERKTVSVTVPSDCKNIAEAVTRALQKVTDDAIETLQKATNAAIEANKFSILRNGHSERYRIVGAKYPIVGTEDYDFVTIERFTTSLFGIAARLVYLIAFVRDTHSTSIWISRRGKEVLTLTRDDGGDSDMAAYDELLTRLHRLLPVPVTGEGGEEGGGSIHHSEEID